MAADPTRASAEADAAGLLYARHYDRVYGYCLYKLGSREEAEDAAQTTFLHALGGLRRGTVPVTEVNWLLKIAHNVCLERYRTRGRRRRLEVLSDPQDLADTPAVREDGAESLVRLEDALARIPEQQRRAILLREWRGLSYREIAEELGLSLAAVETLIFRARRSLAEILGEAEGSRRRHVARGLDVGSLAAALKSLLGGAGAAKIVAGVAAVTAVLVVGPSRPAASEPARLPGLVVPAPPPAPAAERPLARPLPQARREAEPRRTRAPESERAKPKRAKSVPAAQDPAEEPAIAPVVTGVTGAIDGVVAQTGLPVEVETPGLPLEVPDVVTDVAEQATDALPPVSVLP